MVAVTEPSASSRSVNKYSQGWEFEEIRRYGVSNLFRVKIRRDSYNFQSFAMLEKWCSNGGWRTFHSLLGTSKLAFMEIPASVSEEEFWEGGRDWIDLFDQTAEFLWGKCAQFFGPQYDWAGYGWAGQERDS